MALLQNRQQIPDTCEHRIYIGARSRFEDDNAARALRWKAQHVTEIVVQVTRARRSETHTAKSPSSVVPLFVLKPALCVNVEPVANEPPGPRSHCL